MLIAVGLFTSLPSSPLHPPSVHLWGQALASQEWVLPTHRQPLGGCCSHHLDGTEIETNLGFPGFEPEILTKSATVRAKFETTKVSVYRRNILFTLAQNIEGGKQKTNKKIKPKKNISPDLWFLKHSYSQTQSEQQTSSWPSLSTLKESHMQYSLTAAIF